MLEWKSYKFIMLFLDKHEVSMVISSVSLQLKGLTVKGRSNLKQSQMANITLLFCWPCAFMVASLSEHTTVKGFKDRPNVHENSSPLV